MAARRTTAPSMDMPDIAEKEDHLGLTYGQVSANVTVLILAVNSESPSIRLLTSAIGLRRVLLTRSPVVETRRHTVLAPRGGMEMEFAMPSMVGVAPVLVTPLLPTLVHMRLVTHQVAALVM